MKKYWFLVWVACLSPAWAGDTLPAAIAEGRLLLDLRYRLEFVDAAGFSKDALASTLRTRIGYETGVWAGFSLLAEAENVTVIGGETYNSTSNGNIAYPVVADPEDTEINRIQLTFSRWKDHRLIAGRQRINLDNQRFVGAVGWRQNEQTFDALTWQSEAIKGLQLNVSYLANANRVFGESHPTLSDLHIKTLVVHGKFTKLPVGKLSVFAHLIENEDVPASSHKNFGFYLDGLFKVRDGLEIVHEWSYTNQTGYQDGSDLIESDYYMLGIGPKFGALVVKLNLENLGSNRGLYGFSTPLATLHGFNGWADVFLNTPATGLEDLFLSLKYAHSGWTLVGAYHQFSSDVFDLDFGDEADIMLTKKLSKRGLAGIKMADYHGEDLARDTQKIWAWGQWVW